MSQQTFFDNFTLIVNAPNGVARLRKLVLQLAIRGKLAPQDSRDEAATLLAKRILQERVRLTGRIESTTIEEQPRIQQDEKPYSLPNTWIWQRLEDVFYPISVGQNKIKSSELHQSGKFPVVDQGKKYIAGYTDDESKLIKIPGPVIIFGDHTCELKFIDFDFVAGADGVKILRPIEVYEPYFFRVVQTFGVVERGYSRHYKFFLDNLFPVAPLEEQKRIVAKIDELMRLCDELEEREQVKRKSRMRLNNVILKPLNKAHSLAPEEFEQASVRLSDNFGSLYDSVDTVGKLRSTILQLAVQGKLVPQNLNAVPATVLLQGIRKEKDQLIKEGKIKPDRPVPSLTKADVLFSPPQGWEWSKLDSLCNLITDGTHYTPTYVSSGIPFLSVKDISGGKIDFSNTKFISQEEHAALSKRCKPEFEDILFTKIGTTGIAKVVDVESEFSIFVSLALLKFSKNYLSPYFLELLLNSPLVRAQSERDTQGVGNKNLVLKYIKNFVVPIPPLEEQKLIVAKTNQFMMLCDELETKLGQAETGSENLMSAAVQHVLSLTTEPPSLTEHRQFSNG